MGVASAKNLMGAACIGFGIVLACSPLSSTVEVLASLELLLMGSGGWADQLVFALFFIGALCVLGKRDLSGLRLMTERMPTAVVIGLIELGVALVGVAISFSDMRLLVDVLLTTSAALRGMSIGVLLASWIELFSRLSPYTKHFGTSLTGALVLAGAVALGLGVLTGTAAGAIALGALAVLPLIDVALLRWCVVRLDSADVEQGYARGHIDMPFSTQVIIASFGVSLGGTWVVIFSSPSSATALYSCLGFLGASVALVVVTRTVARTREYSFGMLLRIATFASAAAFLLLPVLWPAWPAAAIFSMGCAWAVQIFAYAFMPIQMIEKLPLAPLGVMAAGARPLGMGIVVASIGGGALVAWLGAGIHSLAAVTMLVCLQLLLAAMLMPPQAMDASALGIRSCMERETPLEQLQRRCREVSERCGLTERESEVMLLMAKGLSRVRIAEELVVSRETVKTHAKHIYEKLEVHSLREMTTLIETGKRS